MIFEPSLCLDEQQRESIVEIKAAVKTTDYCRVVRSPTLLAARSTVLHNHLLPCRLHRP
jgi:hypothetical protein